MGALKRSWRNKEKERKRMELIKMQIKVNEYDIEIIEQHLKQVQLNFDIEFRFERRYESEIFDLYISARGKNAYHFDYEELFENLSAIASIEKAKDNEEDISKTIELEIDEAALGNTWHAGKAELKKIAEFYEEELTKQFPHYKFNVIPIIDSWNGAHPSEFEDNTDAWERALKRAPAEWWQ